MFSCEASWIYRYVRYIKIFIIIIIIIIIIITIPFFRCSKILGQAGKQKILQQMFRKF